MRGRLGGRWQAVVHVSNSEQGRPGTEKALEHVLPRVYAELECADAHRAKAEIQVEKPGPLCSGILQVDAPAYQGAAAGGRPEVVSSRFKEGQRLYECLRSATPGRNHPGKWC